MLSALRLPTHRSTDRDLFYYIIIHGIAHQQTDHQRTTQTDHQRTKRRINAQDLASMHTSFEMSHTSHTPLVSYSTLCVFVGGGVRGCVGGRAALEHTPFSTSTPV